MRICKIQLRKKPNINISTKHKLKVKIIEIKEEIERQFVKNYIYNMKKIKENLFKL